MSQNQSTIATENASSVVTTRKAINSSGRLGSLYDARRDHLFAPFYINVRRQQFKSTGSAKCVVINGNLDVSRNILRIIGIEDDLRLNLLLNIVRRIGMVTILNNLDQINEYTRLLYYSWIDREERVSDEDLKNLTSNELIKNVTSATHVITGISFGIDIIVMLQLPSETEIVHQVDRILRKTSASLSSDTDFRSIFTAEDNGLLTKMTKITVYSNIPDLFALENLSRLVHQIDIIKKNSNQCLPVTYSLRPLVLLYSSCIGRDITYHVIPPQLNNDLEQYVLHRQTMRINLKSILNEDVAEFSSGYLKGKLYGLQKQYSHMKLKYLHEMERLSKLLIDFRNGQIAISVIEDALIKNEQTTSTKDINELAQNLIDLKAKANLIRDLRNHNINYRNAVDHDIDKHDDERTLRTKLIRNNPFVRILCSNDTLNQNNNQQLKKLLSDMVGERNRNPDLHLVYADFSYCSYKLHNMMILSTNHKTNNRDIPLQKLSVSFVDSRRAIPLDTKDPSPISSSMTVHTSTKPPPTDDVINILLLGETGIGKSTFINAFANYLMFNSLKQAQVNKPVVIIPVSFVITVGNNFDERTVKYGELDSSNNENFNSIGQSVTQHCKSYIFLLKENGRKLRIIDTPGFGDTRGLDQDDQNMEHILQYINNLTHLNAICFLLKPNSSRLSIFFRTCLTQLFSFLAPAARDNVIFCFTNARSTFYTPGDTAPLLKTMLTSSSISNIPFKKENTFCFDSESFRYLVALRNKIPFTEEDKHEYVKSWSTSAKESNRLVDYTHGNLRPYHIENNWQSTKHAQFEISHMIRPILETIRNILRNLILDKMNPPKVSIQLCPKAALQSIAVCLSCKRHPIQVGHFWIIPDSPHELQNKRCTCSCSTARHKPIDYELEYKAVKNSSNSHPNKVNDILNRLYYASAEFSHFLIHGARSTKGDLFMAGLLQMIREEKDICHEKESHQMNLQLIKELKKALHEYQLQMHEISSNQNHKTLTIVYEQIRTISTYPEIRAQMRAAKEGQKAMMRQYEVIL